MNLDANGNKVIIRATLMQWARFGIGISQNQTFQAVDRVKIAFH